MRIKRWAHLGDSGDTIVEVLIVLAVLSLSFSISYATANGGLRKSQTASEHSQALGILDGQIELLRSAIAHGSTAVFDPDVKAFCLPNPSDPTQIAQINETIPQVASQDNLSGDTTASPPSNRDAYALAGCTQGTEGRYHMSIVYSNSGPQSHFDLRVRWPGLGDLGVQQEEFVYKPQATEANDDSPFDNPAAPSQLLKPGVRITHSPANGPSPLTFNWTIIPNAAPVDLATGVQCRYDSTSEADWAPCSPTVQKSYPATPAAADRKSHTFEVRVSNAFGSSSDSYTWTWITSSSTTTVPQTTSVWIDPPPVWWGYYCDFPEIGQGCYDHWYDAPGYWQTTTIYVTQTVDTSHWSYPADD